MDDLCIWADFPAQAQVSVERTVSVLLDLGFLLNRRKSELIPSRLITYLGMSWNAESVTYSVPHFYLTNIAERAESLIQHRRTSCLQFESLLGKIASAAQISQRGKLFIARDTEPTSIIISHPGQKDSPDPALFVKALARPFARVPQDPLPNSSSVPHSDGVHGRLDHRLGSMLVNRSHFQRDLDTRTGPAPHKSAGADSSPVHRRESPTEHLDSYNELQQNVCSSDQLNGLQKPINLGSSCKL